MRVAALQLAADIDPAANRTAVDARLGDLSAGAHDLVVLPEAVHRDFGSPDDDLRPTAETVDGPFVDLVAAHAKRLGSVVVAGMFERTDDPDDLPYNTLVALGPDGDLLASYRKIHLYDSFGYRESDRLRPGPTTPVTVPVGDQLLGLMTCYDLRFPELARSLIDSGVDLIALPAAWVAGEGKLHHWRTLVLARAIENTVPIVAVAQTEPRYTGHSLIVDAAGTIMTEADGASAMTIQATVDPRDTEETRSTNPSLSNRRDGLVSTGGGAR